MAGPIFSVTKITTMTQETIYNPSQSLFDLALSQMYYRKAADKVYSAKLYAETGYHEAEAICLAEARAEFDNSASCLERVSLQDLRDYRNSYLEIDREGRAKPRVIIIDVND